MLKNGVFTLASCWFNTAIANIFKTIEIPFVLFFLSHSFNRNFDVAKLGIFLSVIMLSSSVLIPLATPTAAGASLSSMRRLFPLTLVLSYLINCLSSFLLFVYFNSSSFLLKDFLFHLFFVTAAISLIAIRRVFQGVLLYLKKSYALTLASFFRIIVTVALCLIVPASFSSFAFAVAILMTGAVVETALVFIFYFLSRSDKYSGQTSYLSLKAYMPITMLPVAIQVQSYALNFFVIKFYGRENLTLWLVVYSFISILSGMNLEVDNIILRYKFQPSKYWFLLAPLVTLFMFIYLFLVNDFIRYKYFIEFQGITKIEHVVSLRYAIFVLGVLFVLQQALRGYVLISQKLSVTGKAAVIGVVSIVFTALLMRDTFVNAIKMPLLALLLGVFTQNIYMATQLYRLGKKKESRLKSSELLH